MHASNKNPTLLVFAGPNGSGKSTTTNFCDIAGQYINADVIKTDLACSDIEAAETAENIREKYLAQRKDFTFETVLSTDRNLDLIARANILK